MRFKLTLFVLTIFVSCTNYVSNSGLADYILDEENGLAKEYNRDDFKIKMFYYPSDFFLQREAKVKSLHSIDSIAKNYNNFVYFVLNIDNRDVDIFSQPNSFNQDIFTVVRELIDECKIYSGTSQLYLQDYYINRYYLSDKATDILLVLNKNDINSDNIKFVFSSYFFNINKAEIIFQTKDLKRLPKLKL